MRMDRGPGPVGRRLCQKTTPAESKLLVDCSREELTRAAPELASMQFDDNQDRLDALLRATCEDLAAMFGKLVDVAATEQIHEMRFEDGMREASQKETYRYLVKPSDELRLDPATGAPAAPPAAGFLVLSHFENLLRYLLPRVARSRVSARSAGPRLPDMIRGWWPLRGATATGRAWCGLTPRLTRL